MIIRDEIEKNIGKISDSKWEEIQSLSFNNNIRKLNLTGKHFTNLYVLGKGPDYISPSSKQVQWYCICKCQQHNIILVRACNLTSSNTKSCGCLNMQQRKINIRKAINNCKLDLTNQQFGELIALEPTDERKNNSIVWKCKCSCGKICYKPANELNNGRIISCGHIGDSKGVYIIKQLLQENNINYETEKTFIDCVFPDSQAYGRFDFYLPEYNRLIEFDGIQHFQERDTNYFRDSLEKRQMHDKIKNDYAKQMGIPLVRIPYTQLKDINLDMLLGDEYLIL